jgi:NDP-sugar pyrophosphorylase family protein
MQAAILAGGLGTRLYPMTHDVPKAMVPVAGRPFLEREIELLRQASVTDIVLLVGHLADQITDHFGDGSRFGVRIRYSNEGPKLLDTAGAVRQAMDLLDDTFFVTFADSYLVLPYRQIWDDFHAAGKEALMVVYRNDNQFDTSDVFVEDGLVLAYQKSPPLPGAFYINDGLMIFRRDSLKAIAEGERISLQQFLQPVVARRQLMAWKTQQRFFEIGSFSGLKELEERFLAETSS